MANIMPIVHPCAGICSKQPGTIEQEGYRAIVDAANVHIFAEHTFFNDYALLGDQLDYFFVKLLCRFRLGCGVKAGPATLSAITVKSKIAD